MLSGNLLGIGHAKTLADLGRGRELGMKSVVLGLAAENDLEAMKGVESKISHSFRHAHDFAFQSVFMITI